LYGLCPAERLTLHEADLLSDGSFESAIDGADIVFHTASPFFMGGFSDAQAELIEPAVNGTRNVISSAIAAGVKRIVLTSSMAAIAECARPIINVAPVENSKWKRRVSCSAKNGVPAPDKVYTEDDWNNVSTILNNPSAPHTHARAHTHSHSHSHTHTHTPAIAFFAVRMLSARPEGIVRRYALSKTMAERTAWQLVSEASASLRFALPALARPPAVGRPSVHRSSSAASAAAGMAPLRFRAVGRAIELRAPACPSPGLGKVSRAACGAPDASPSCLPLECA